MTYVFRALLGFAIIALSPIWLPVGFIIMIIVGAVMYAHTIGAAVMGDKDT